MKRVLLMLCVMLMSIATFAAKANKQTVVFDVDLHCQGCINKIEKNIAFEKGVKDLICDLKAQTVVVVFDANKTSVQTLQKAFEAIGKKAVVNEKATQAATSTTSSKTDATSAATPHTQAQGR